MYIVYTARRFRTLLICIAGLLIGMFLTRQYNNTSTCSDDPYLWSEACADVARKNAEQGSTIAMMGLFFYTKPKNMDEGVQWLMKAARNGEKSALGFLIVACGTNSAVKRVDLHAIGSEQGFSEGAIDQMVADSGNNHCR